MFTRVLPALLLLMSSSVYALEFPSEIIETLDDTTIIAYLNESDINKTAKWRPSASEPPLSIAGAVAELQRYITANPHPGKESLRAIELKQIPRHKHYWHYLVRTRVKNEGGTANHFYMVLMDGKVIPAIMEPESYK